MSPFLETFKRFPQQIQNLGIIQKIHDKISRPGEEIACQLSSNYGQPCNPSCLDYDEELSLLAIGSHDGKITIYGTPGVTFEIPSLETVITSIKFLPGEGRILVLTSENDLIVFELATSTGSWEKKFAVRPILKPNEAISSLCLGNGIIYYGTDRGTLRQAAIKQGLIALDSDVHALTCELLGKNSSLEKQEELGLDSSIVSVELHASGSYLLVAYRGGTVAILKILSESDKTNEQTATSSEVPVQNGHSEEATTEETSKSTEAKITSDVKQASSTLAPRKTSQEESALAKKSKTLTMTLKNSLTHLDSRSKHGHYEQPDLSIPPMPSVTNFLTYGRQCLWAAWSYPKLGDLESLKVVAALSEGYYSNTTVTPSTDKTAEPSIESVGAKASNPFGPIPCHAIRKISIKPSSDDLITVFVGGLPTQENTDLYTVVVNNSKDNVTYRFAAPVVDFLVISSNTPNSPDSPQKLSENEEERKQELEKWKEIAENYVTKPSAPSNAGFLIVLTQNELVIIDLTTSGWPQVMNPYLSCLDVSSVSSISHIGGIERELLEKLLQSSYLNKQQNSLRWPIIGGSGVVAKTSNPTTADLMALGHEDGTISLWNMEGGDSFLLVGMLHGNSITNCGQHDAMESTPEEAWPPYRSVGVLQQFALTPAKFADCQGIKCSRCNSPASEKCKCNAIRSLHFYRDGAELNLLSGGEMGQVILWSTAAPKNKFEPDTQRVLVELIQEEEMAGKFSWNGSSIPMVREGTQLNCKWAEFLLKPQRLFQMVPPSPIHHVNTETKWNLVAFGSSHGMAVYDLANERLVHKIFTPAIVNAASCNNEETSQSAENASHEKGPVAALKNRGGMLKSTLRQSFKKLRKFTSQSGTAQESKTLESTPENKEVEKTEDADKPVDDAQTQETAETKKEEEPVAVPSSSTDEKPVAEEPVEEAVKPVHIVNLHPGLPQWIVKSVDFGCTCLNSIEKQVPVMLVGTGSGNIFMYSMLSYFEETPAELKLCKELQLQHAAPILGVYFLNSKTRSPVETLSLDEVKAMAKAELEARLAEEARIQAEKEAAEKARLEAEEQAKKEKEEIEVKKDEPADKPAEESKPDEPTKVVQETKEEPEKAKDVPEADDKKSKKEKTPEPAVPTFHHDLLVCTQEQAKLFSVPHLKPKQKYKFVDRGAFVGFSGTPMSSKKASKPEVENCKEEVGPDGDKAPEDTCCKAPNVNHSLRKKRVLSVGLQALPLAHEVKETTPSNEDVKVNEEWYLVAGLSTGSVSIHSLPTLRRQVKCACCPGTVCCPVECVAMSEVGHSVVAHCPTNGTVSVVETCASTHHLAVQRRNVIYLQPWMRSVDLLTLCTDLAKEAVHTLTETIKEEATKVAEAVNVAVESVVPHEKPSDDSPVKQESETPLKSKLASSIVNEETLDKSIVNGSSNAQNLADMTMDTVKDYINGEENVTVHTIESSTVKKTVIKGGDIVTTVHEQQKEDGKVVKDDVVNVSAVSAQKTA